MSMRAHRGIKLTVVIAALVAVSFALGWFLSRTVTLREIGDATAQPVRFTDPEYPFIHPLVSIAIPNAAGFPELERVKNDVTAITKKAVAGPDVSDVGVYFREPNNAHWFGIGENSKFDPGSLIKVPIMLAYLKQSELDPGVMKKRLYYDPSKKDSLPNPLPAQLPRGWYTAEQLLRSMIVDSDNVAKDVLFDSMSATTIQDVFDEMSANFLKDPSGTISPKEYIIIISRIFSATYLDREHSNYAMKLLTQTSYKDGLVAGLPSTVKVAHKYGDRGIYEDGKPVGMELHDCGLVYADANPYNLCVMTKGTDGAAQAKVIRDISAAVYRDRKDF